MADARQPPLNYEASATTTHPQVSTTLPPEVVTCLSNARFLHLATCSPQTLHPHVSLMNYTYLPSTPYTPFPVIIMTTTASSKKTLNLLSNPHVSLLVHDWVSHRPPTRSPDPLRSGSPPPAAARSSLASLLLNINTAALSSISTTIEGEATIVEAGSEEERWCKRKHLENNTFGDQAREEQGVWGIQGPPAVVDGVTQGEERGRSASFIEGEEVRVVTVRVKEGRIADWKGGVKDWAVVPEEGPEGNGTGDEAGREDLVNGIMEDL